ncbi:hypothetical protein DFJ73DRAFT_835235, partial [Zopfochytrium polystomum]
MVCGVSFVFGLYIATRTSFASALGIAVVVFGVLVMLANGGGAAAVVKNHKVGIQTFAIVYAFGALIEAGLSVWDFALVVNPSVRANAIDECVKGGNSLTAMRNATLDAEITAKLQSLCSSRIPAAYTFFAIQDVLAIALAAYFATIVLTFARDFARNPAKYTTPVARRKLRGAVHQQPPVHAEGAPQRPAVPVARVRAAGADLRRGRRRGPGQAGWRRRKRRPGASATAASSTTSACRV